METISLWKGQVFDTLKADDSLIVKFQGKRTWPSLMTSQMRLASAASLFLEDSFSSSVSSATLSLHPSLAPYSMGILIETGSNSPTDPSKRKELADLRRLLHSQLARICGSATSLLPPSADWSAADCDARGIPCLILLQSSTLDQGICFIRSRDTTIKVCRVNFIDIKF